MVTFLPAGTPDAGQFFRVIETHGVNALFVAPTAIRAIRREDPAATHAQQHDLRSLRYLFVAGEHCDHGTRLWAQEHFRHSRKLKTEEKAEVVVSVLKILKNRMNSSFSSESSWCNSSYWS